MYVPVGNSHCGIKNKREWLKTIQSKNFYLKWKGQKSFRNFLNSTRDKTGKNLLYKINEINKMQRK